MPSPIILALDYPSVDEAKKLVDQLDPSLCRLKIGQQLFTTAGPKVIETFIDKGFDIFLDLKFYDIPNTVSKAVVAAAKLGVWMVNVHASGGYEMMSACREALDSLHLLNPPLLIAVTVLTSFNEHDLRVVGWHHSIEKQITLLAQLAQKSRMDGVVCSPQDLKLIKEACDEPFLFVTPGVRWENTLSNDQKRITTPEQAIKNGANYLVIGRPITQASHPVKVLENILDQLKRA